LLTGQIDVENTDKNYRLSNIKSTATCKHHMQEVTGCYYRERDSLVFVWQEKNNTNDMKDIGVNW